MILKNRFIHNKKKMNETLIIIPARSGSKRIKNKNIRIVNGKPLIYWTIKYAKKYSKNEDIIVSSDSKIVGDISRLEKVKFLKRPKKISGDKASVYFAINHVLKTTNFSMSKGCIHISIQWNDYLQKLHFEM